MYPECQELPPKVGDIIHTQPLILKWTEKKAAADLTCTLNGTPYLPE